MNSSPAMSTEGLERSIPEAQGISQASVLAFLDAARARKLALHSFMVLRHGKVVAEGWWQPYERETPHMLFSLSKSFTSTAIGLAIEEGLLNLDDRVISFFPELAPAEPSANLLAMTIRNLLTMSTGQVEAVRPELSREPGTDWVKSFLEQPTPNVPGSKFDYSTPATYMCSAILHRVAGIDLLDYLMPRLFEPLGIPRPEWQRSPTGISFGGSGLFLTTESVAKFGQLYLQRGMWEGKKLVPESWIDMATSKQISNDQNQGEWALGYGFQFWRCKHNAYRGDGAFGQFCVVCNEQDLVFVATSSTGDLQGVLDCLWSTIFAELQDQPLASQPDVMSARLKALSLEGPAGGAGAKLDHLYLSEGGDPCDIAAGPNAVALRFSSDGKEWNFVAGYREWMPFTAATGHSMAGKAGWASESELRIESVDLNSPMRADLVVLFEGSAVSVKTTVSGHFGPTEGPGFSGSLRG